MTARGLLRVLPLALLLLGTGAAPSSCVDFDGQTVVAHVDTARDRLDLLLVYRDLHATENDPSGALAQLETLRGGERWIAFFSNWPFMLHVESLRGDASPDRPALGGVIEALDRRVEVRPGPLWLDAAGRLCGRQLVRVSGLADLVARINASLLERLADEQERASFYADLDDESRSLLAAAVEAHHAFVSLRGTALALTLPISDRGFEDQLRALLRETLSEAGKAWGRTPEESPERRQMEAALALLARTPWAVERTTGRVTFVLGDPRETSWTVDVLPTGRKHRSTLLPALREAGWTILGPEQEAASREVFETFVAET